MCYGKLGLYLTRAAQMASPIFPEALNEFGKFIIYQIILGIFAQHAGMYLNCKINAGDSV